MCAQKGQLSPQFPPSRRVCRHNCACIISWSFSPRGIIFLCQGFLKSEVSSNAVALTVAVHCVCIVYLSVNKCYNSRRPKSSPHACYLFNILMQVSPKVSYTFVFAYIFCDFILLFQALTHIDRFFWCFLSPYKQSYIYYPHSYWFPFCMNGMGRQWKELCVV